MLKVLRDRRGMTLVEALMVMVIVGVLAVSAAPLMRHVNRFFLLNRTRLEIQREARTALNTIARNLRQAQINDLDSNPDNDRIRIDQLDNNQPPFSRIDFTKRTSGATPVRLTYYQRGRALVEEINGVARPLADNLHSVSFRFPDSTNPNVVSIFLTMEKPTYQGQVKTFSASLENIRILN